MSPIQNLIGKLTRDGLMVGTGAAILAAFLFLTYAAVYVPIVNHEVVNILTGQTMTLASGIVGYYFGTSKSSAEKTRMIADKEKV
jgi:hypothetical protein